MNKFDGKVKSKDFGHLLSKMSRLPNFGQNKNFSQKNAFITFCISWTITSFKTSKRNELILWKQRYRLMHRWMAERWTDGQNWIHWTIRLRWGSKNISVWFTFFFFKISQHKVKQIWLIGNIFIYFSLLRFFNCQIVDSKMFWGLKILNSFIFA